MLKIMNLYDQDWENAPLPSSLHPYRLLRNGPQLGQMPRESKIQADSQDLGRLKSLPRCLAANGFLQAGSRSS